jgi:hypothetical protein
MLVVCVAAQEPYIRTFTMRGKSSAGSHPSMLPLEALLKPGNLALDHMRMAFQIDGTR